MSCATRHHITARVNLKLNGHVVATSGDAYFHNAPGFGIDGYGRPRVLQTPRVCGAGNWQTVLILTLHEPGYGTTTMTSGSPDYIPTPC